MMLTIALNIIKSVLSLIGSYWLIIEFTAWVNPDLIKLLKPFWFIIPTSVLIQIFYLIIKNITFSYPINNSDIRISLKMGNIFKNKGVIVIGVNTEFDTILGNGIVSCRTLHGKFINNYFRNKEQNLSNIISNQLKGIGSIPREKKEKGNRHQYPIGTCVSIENDNTKFILIAISTFDDSCRAHSDLEQLRVAYSALWEYISHQTELENIYIPILGSTLSRVNVDRTYLAKEILKSFIAAAASSKFTENMTLVIPLKWAFSNIIKFEEICNYIKYLCSFREISSENCALGATD